MSNEELIALIKKNPISVACLVLSLALFGGWYYRNGEVPAKEQDLQQKSAEAQRYALNLTNATQLQEQYDALLVVNKEVAARLVSKDIGKNYEYLYKIEGESGAKLSTDPRQSMPTPPKKDAPKTVYAAIPFSLSLQGDYAQLLAFLRRLESGAHYGRVLGATLSVPPERSMLLNLSLNFELLGLP